MTASAQRGPGALVRAFAAALRGEEVALPALLPPAPSGLGYPAPSAYPRLPMPSAAALAPAGLTPAGAIEMAAAELAELEGVEPRHARPTGGGPHPDRRVGPSGPRAHPLGSPAADAQARSRATEHRPQRGRPAEESRMNATIIDLQTERLARRRVRAGAVSSAAEMAETCRVLLFHRRAARAPRVAVGNPSTGPGRRADLQR
ncbi:hypothetical protein [Actinomycetospora sp.]|jgi:hypothetical protein|uniref:hypothetical protein n=1 Tax=Actinomycetospora sp. TaxID=1872135 RepID=UPI002F41C91C